MKKIPILTIVVTSAVAVVWLTRANQDLPAQQVQQNPTVEGRSGVRTSRVALLQDVARPKPPTGDHKPVEARKPGESDPAALAVLKQAREGLEDYRPIRADLTETIAMAGRKIKAKGKYFEGKDYKLRLEFSLSIGDTKNSMRGSLLQVCDGRVLWTELTVGKKNSKQGGQIRKKPRIRITRRDVREILAATEENGVIEPHVLEAELGLGGLQALLASFEKKMVFGPVKQEKIGDVSFVVIQGAWNEEFLNAFQPPNQNSPAGQTRLPNHVPDFVRIHFDRKKLFPRKIQYFKKHSTREFYLPVVTLKFVNVVLNARVEKGDFDYAPPEGVFDVNDITKQYTAGIKAAAARRKAAAKLQVPAKSQPEAKQPQGPPKKK